MQVCPGTPWGVLGRVSFWDVLGRLGTLGRLGASWDALGRLGLPGAHVRFVWSQDVFWRPGTSWCVLGRSKTQFGACVPRRLDASWDVPGPHKTT